MQIGAYFFREIISVGQPMMGATVDVAVAVHFLVRPGEHGLGLEGILLQIVVLVNRANEFSVFRLDFPRKQ